MWDRIAIISLNYNSLTDTIRQLSFLLQEGVPASCFYVVDNHSSDQKELDNFCSRKCIRFIPSFKNGGYAYGNNLAIRNAIQDGKDVFLLLNPDIEISKYTITKLYEKLVDCSDLQIIAPRICDKYQRDLIYSDGGIITPHRAWDDHVHYNILKSQVKKNIGINVDIDYVNGSVMMFKKEVLEIIGYMREDFFMYYEETEWCYRLKKYPQYKIGVFTEVEAYHQMSDKGSFFHYYVTKNRIWFFRIHGFKYGKAVKKMFTSAFKAIFRKDEQVLTRKIAHCKLITKAIVHGLLINNKYEKNHSFH
ncbi:hypothetical protein HMPREF9700_00612 [Bergeyella zoohelcum CCUG 30536]|uniref:Rhamnosyltransferase n=1 Tax=Bergeyella zoohelcum TaxID=1015 RepID=A0A376BZ88_9FLAO|nr:hypothetical protein HMPREF9700_00612 [Bergeyella zoohelcum CCUG 30536]SSZ46791.1 rhamnosyltransferase [Bergeyella zoohelcum]